MPSSAFKHLTFRARDAHGLLACVDAFLRGESVHEQVGPAALCIVARDREHALTLLEEAAASLRRGEAPNRVAVRATLNAFGRDALVGMFPGQGSQARGMLAFLGRGVEAAEGDVLSDGSIEEEDILLHDGQQIAVGGEPPAGPAQHPAPW